MLTITLTLTLLLISFVSVVPHGALAHQYLSLTALKPDAYFWDRLEGVYTLQNRFQAFEGG